MEKGIETGFKDKSGNNIHIDDVTQHRLEKFGKAHSGPTRRRVVRSGKEYHLMLISDQTRKYGGIELTDQICQKSVVIDCPHVL